jgi:hypothetical protein
VWPDLTGGNTGTYQKRNGKSMRSRIAGIIARSYTYLMTILRKPKMTVDEYLAWSLDQPEPVRADLIDGEVYAQAS